MLVKTIIKPDEHDDFALELSKPAEGFVSVRLIHFNTEGESFTLSANAAHALAIQLLAMTASDEEI